MLADEDLLGCIGGLPPPATPPSRLKSDADPLLVEAEPPLRKELVLPLFLLLTVRLQILVFLLVNIIGKYVQLQLLKIMV